MSVSVALRVDGGPLFANVVACRAAASLATAAFLTLGACTAPVEQPRPIGRTDLGSGDFARVEGELLRIVDRCRQSGDARCDLSNSITLGACEYALEELAPAASTFRHAMAVARQLGSTSSEAVAETNLAGVLLAQREDRLALEAAEAAARLAVRAKNDLVRVEALAQWSLALTELGNPGGALAAAEDAEKASRGMSARDSQVTLLQIARIGSIWRRLGRCERAEALFSGVLARADTSDWGLLAFEAHLGLARCARQRGDSAAERDQLRLARAAGRFREQQLQGRVREAWRHQMRPLDAAELEALNRNPGPWPGDLAYSFALLYELDGDAAAELRALLRVSGGSPDHQAAATRAATLLQRVRTVQQSRLALRDSPDSAAQIADFVAPGTWIELVGRSGGWIKIRLKGKTLFATETDGARAALRPVAAPRGWLLRDI